MKYTLVLEHRHIWGAKTKKKIEEEEEVGEHYGSYRERGGEEEGCGGAFREEEGHRNFGGWNCWQLDTFRGIKLHL